MIDLALSILSSSLIFIAFKLFGLLKIRTLNAIIVNYITACLVGLLLYQGELEPHRWVEAPWAWGPPVMGILFISVFNLMALTSQRAGVSVASVATKMSLVIPVLLGVALYGDRLSPVQLLGVLLALAAVYLASQRGEKISLGHRELLLPILVFLGSGLIDAGIKFFEQGYLDEKEIPLFSSMVFGCAALTGLAFVGIKSLKGPLAFRSRDVLGGVLLGVPNYFSIFFLIRALRWEAFNSASTFTLNNVGIVLFSTLLGILLFRERLSGKNWAGVALAIIGILLVALF